MPYLANRVQETTTTSGTGTVTLGGAVTGYVTFISSFTVGDAVYYAIDNGSGEWEIGIGTLVTSSTLSRDTVIESSNSNALVNFSAGTKRIFCTAPTQVLLPNQTGNSGKVLTTDGTSPSWTATLNGVSIGGTTPAAGSFTTLSTTGNVTLGDAAADTVTLNANTVTLNNSTTISAASTKTLTLNGGAGSNGLVLDASNNIMVGPEIYRGSTTSYIRIAGGDTASAGANIILFGQSHASAPGQISLTALGTGATVFNTGGAERMRLDSSGNLGIGTSSPSYKLDVSGVVRANVASYNQFIATRSSQSWVMGIDASNNWVVRDETGGDTKVYLSTSGNLGLGVTPSAWTTNFKAFQIYVSTIASG